MRKMYAIRIKNCVAVFLLTVSFASAAHAQTIVHGKYFMQHAMMGNELILQKNHSFKLRAVNWESGNGAIHYGKWIFKNDTLVLEYKYFRAVKRVGKRSSETSRKRIGETNSDSLIVFEDNLCFVLPINNDCYKKK
jgi:hypothetical protein